MRPGSFELVILIVLMFFRIARPRRPAGHHYSMASAASPLRRGPFAMFLATMLALAVMKAPIFR
jgi:hypothetical protein